MKQYTYFISSRVLNQEELTDSLLSGFVTLEKPVEDFPMLEVQKRLCELAKHLKVESFSQPVNPETVVPISITLLKTHEVEEDVELPEGTDFLEWLDKEFNSTTETASTDEMIEWAFGDAKSCLEKWEEYQNEQNEEETEKEKEN
jgi:hypothetical protein